VVWQDWLIVTGGTWNNGVDHDLNDVHLLQLLPGGAAGAWVDGAPFPTQRYGHASVVRDGFLYVIGGGRHGSGDLNDVQVSLLGANGKPAGWFSTQSFTNPRSGHAVVAYNRIVYLMGGASGGTVYGDAQLADIQGRGASGPSGVIPTGGTGGWSGTMPLPAPRADSAAAVWNGRIYLLGGYGGSPTPAYLSSVTSAAVNPDDSLGAWTSMASFTGARSGAGAAAWNGFLYLIGGQINNTGFRADIQRAPINPDGSLGAWSNAGSLPTGRAYLGVVATQGFLYVTGGRSGAGQLTDVLMYPFNPDGSLGTMSTLSALPVKRQEHAVAAYNGYLYVMGGFNNTNQDLNDVQIAPINPNGTIGAWSAGANLPLAMDEHAALAENGILYLLGGEDVAGTPRSTVYFAPLYHDGHLGAWQSSPGFTSARIGHAAVASGGNLYLLGGSDSGGALLGDTQHAQLRWPKAVGRYSTRFDLGSLSTLNSLQFMSLGPGARNLSYATQGLFGFDTAAAIPGAVSGTVYPSGTCARYVAVSFDLDDGAVNAWDLDGSGVLGLMPGAVTRVTLDFGPPAPPASPGDSLRIGKSGADAALSWGASAGASSYRVHRCNVPRLHPAIHHRDPDPPAIHRHRIGRHQLLRHRGG
jgi:N-acetylneuraminic acid mutarotase